MKTVLRYLLAWLEANTCLVEVMERNPFGTLGLVAATVCWTICTLAVTVAFIVYLFMK